MFRSHTRFKPTPVLPMPSVEKQWEHLLRKQKRTQNILTYGCIAMACMFWLLLFGGFLAGK